MTTKDFEVIDRYGKRVRRDGTLQDGDRMTVPMRMMDAQNPALVAAAALADTVRRNEQFDARHRPGFATTPQDAYAAGDAAREARDASIRDAWRNPAPVIDTAKPSEPAALVPVTAPNAQLFAARAQAIADRDRRVQAAWKS